MRLHHERKGCCDASALCTPCRWCSGADYERLATELGLQGVCTDDWTASDRRFWPAGIASALRPRALWGLLRYGLTAIFKGALVMPLMIRGQKRGTIKFALRTATKPAAAA